MILSVKTVGWYDSNSDCFGRPMPHVAYPLYSWLSHPLTPSHILLHHLTLYCGHDHPSMMTDNGHMWTGLPCTRLLLSIKMTWQTHDWSLCYLAVTAVGWLHLTTTPPHSLTPHLCQCDSLGQFKRLLKTHLFGSWDRDGLWHFC